VLLETPAVRLLEIVSEPGDREPEHALGAVMIVDDPARIGTLTF
jgi:hypothetical protein